MEKKIKLYIHLGFPKTASTLLQNYYFSSISEIKYLNNNNSNLKKLIQRMLFYKLDKYKNQKKRINRIVNNISFSSDKVNIISDESVTDLSTNDEINPWNIIEQFNLTFPKFEKIIKSFGAKYIRLKNNSDSNKVIKKLLNNKGPIICEILTNENQPSLFKQGYKKNSNNTFEPQPLSEMYPFIEKPISNTNN